MKYTFILISALLLIGCSKNENALEKIVPLEGYYSLVLVSCECLPIEIIDHQQQWLFDFENLEVDLKIFGEVKSHILLDAGKYTFEITNNGSMDIIQIDNRQFGLIQNENSIDLSSGTPFGIDDFPAYLFVKNK